MRQDNSADGNELGRRRFLGGLLGLGTGATALGAAHSSTFTDTKTQLSATSLPRSMSEYERRLAHTERMEVLGHPPDWSVVRDRFHPFHPQRIVVLPSGTLLRYDHRCGRDLRRKIDAGIEKFQTDVPHGSAPLPEEKLESTYWIMDLMTGHYRVPELFEDWVLGLAARESLGSSGIGCHFGLVHQFQRGGEIQVDCPPIDWWLFLFPAGIDWGSLDDEPAHALVGHVSRFPFGSLTGLAMYPAWCLTSALTRELDDWRAVSRMGRIEAARHLNEITVRLLEEMKN
jgi:hypothetical protein